MEEIETGIWRLTAPNPSPLTYLGTNSYLVEVEGGLSVIDPGPDSPEHLNALLRAIGNRPLSRIIVTHAHRDHAPLASPLSQATGAPIHAFGPADAGRSRVMTELAARGLAGGGEGHDASFAPDVTVADGALLGPFEVIHTPGHMGCHICLALGDVVFSGDHVMGWATSLVSPPDGDLTDFMASCQRLLARPARRYLPGHGDPVEDPEARLRWLIAHRQEREAQILSALATAPGTVPALTARVYTDVAPHLLPAAERNVFAHLVDLTGRGLAHPDPLLSLSATFHATRANYSVSRFR